jgi:hypothetical protein
MWSLKLTILFLATTTDPSGHTSVIESLNREVVDNIRYSDEQSCSLKAQWWMSPAASATGAVKKAECVQADQNQKRPGGSVRGPDFPTSSKRGSAYPRAK